MSQSRTYEGRSIEDALRSAAADLGPDVEVLDASRQRSGGVLGFFSKERFVVTASPRSPEPEPAEADFGDILLRMADEVEDTYETALVPATPEHDAIEERARRALAARAERPEPGSIGVIDLREGRRVPRQAHDARDVGARAERPSQLRRRLEPPTVPTASAHPTGGIHVLDGPAPNVGDSGPAWSLDALGRIGLSPAIVACVAEFDPTSDIEWLHAVAIAIGRSFPEPGSPPRALLAGDGRRSAVDLVRALEAGLTPGVLVVDGEEIAATPDELAFSIREMLR